MVFKMRINKEDQELNQDVWAVFLKESNIPSYITILEATAIRMKEIYGNNKSYIKLLPTLTIISDDGFECLYSPFPLEALIEPTEEDRTHQEKLKEDRFHNKILDNLMNKIKTCQLSTHESELLEYIEETFRRQIE